VRRFLLLAAIATVPVASRGAAPASGEREVGVTIGSKAFTESILLGELAAQLVRSAGGRAEHRRSLGGTRVAWEALLRGEIDAYPDYTGTLEREILGGGALNDAQGLDAALAPKGVAVSRSLGFEDRYAIGVRRNVAEKLGLTRLSDLARHPELRLGFTNEFMDRADGWPALRARYRLPATPVRGLDHDVAYRALRAEQLDATDVYTTDPEIRSQDLVLLEDDRHAFPDYQAVLVYRIDLRRRAPRALAAMLRMEGRVSQDEMAGMNERAQRDRVDPAVVAGEFLESALGIPAAPAREGMIARILGRTREHLELVGIALLAAIACAVPLGIVAARRPLVGRAILAVVGVVQTVPALALLVFMIPFLGIGGAPAIAALFLYALLPIVRNVHAGLTGISPDLRDAARALGMTSSMRLVYVELPLAAPTIIAGIRTAAVITVGGAALGALVGAGGYGQPILAGVRLASVPLILEGAIPAALLALAVERIFGLVERAVVSPGLRLRPEGQRRRTVSAHVAGSGKR
jgi:osmoprotectant transport system permease protein